MATSANPALKTAKSKTLGVMTVDYSRWEEFTIRLFETLRLNDCSHGRKCELARKILTAMGASARDITESLVYFSENGGYCDCEILLNVESRLYQRLEESPFTAEITA